jgi:stress response protein YsnF
MKRLIALALLALASQAVVTFGEEKETIRETVRREGVDVDESGKTTRLGKGINEEKL